MLRLENLVNVTLSDFLAGLLELFHAAVLIVVVSAVVLSKCIMICNFKHFYFLNTDFPTNNLFHNLWFSNSKTV